MNEVLFKNANEKIRKLTDLIQSTIKGTHFEGKVYYVGGCIRDLLLGLDVKDIDIVVEMNNGGILFAGYMAMKHKCFAANTNPVVFETYGTAKFQLYKDEDLKDIEIECVQTRKEQYHKESRNPDTAYGTIQEDAARRDLTINALYYNISTEEVFDFNKKGLDDLCNQVIRTPSDPDIIFKDDPLRMLRVIRFSNKLGWGIEKNTWLGILKNVNRIDIVSQERVSDEISKILLCRKPSIGIRKLYFSGLLDRVMPDIYDLNLAYESKNPAVTSFEHTMNVLDETQPYIENRLAALFHDVGKIITDKDRTISPDQFSAEIASTDLKMMKFPNHIIKSVDTAIRYHRLFRIYADGVVPPDKKIRKFVNLCGDEIGTVVDLMNANNQHVTFDKKKRQVLDILNRIEELEEIEKMTNIKLPISGSDIMTEFRLKASPLIGILLEAVKDAYFENPNITKDECFGVVEKKLKSIT
jgi:tRNA nucleotidyltransferase/poly(A) polymerase